MPFEQDTWDADNQGTEVCFVILLVQLGCLAILVVSLFFVGTCGPAWVILSDVMFRPGLPPWTQPHQPSLFLLDAVDPCLVKELFGLPSLACKVYLW